jgi:hypothetical protein
MKNITKNLEQYIHIPNEYLTTYCCILGRFNEQQRITHWHSRNTNGHRTKCMLGVAVSLTKS